MKLNWLRLGESWVGQRGTTRRATFYKVFPSAHGGGRWGIESYLPGATHGAGNFETRENAQEYAEIDFADWLSAFGLTSDD